MYELLVMSLLMDWPLHAYLIAEIANNILGPWEQINRGTLSPLLARLERDGLIAEADPVGVPFPTKRASRALAITRAGRDRFRRLMRDTMSNPGSYDRIFHIKALHLHLLRPEEQRDLLDHYIAYCKTARRYLEHAEEDMTANPTKRRHTPEPLRVVATDLMRTRAEQWDLEIGWAQRILVRLGVTSPDIAPMAHAPEGSNHA